MIGLVRTSPVASEYLSTVSPQSVFLAHILLTLVCGLVSPGSAP